MSGTSAGSRPVDLRTVLRAAFAQEVAERLPRLVENTDTDLVRRDAHTLVSSATVIDEPEIAQAARDVERGASPETLVALLQAWAP